MVDDPRKQPEDSGLKRRPTEPYAAKPDDATRSIAAASEDATRTLSAMADEAGKASDPLGAGPLDAGRSEPSQPGAVIAPVTNRRKRTVPYSESAANLVVTPPPKGAPPKRSLVRRILKGVRWTLAVLLLLVGLAIGFFHTGPGKDVARGIVEGALAKRFDGEVTLGEIDYALFGDVSLKDLKIKEKGGGRTVVHLHDVNVSLAWGSLLSKPITIEDLRLTGLDLDLVQFADGTNNLKRMQKEQSKLPDTLVIEKLSVSGVNVHIERPDGSRLALTDVTVAGLAAFDGPAKKVDAKLTTLSATVASTRGEAFALSLPLAATLTASVDGARVAVNFTPKPSVAKLTRAGVSSELPVVLGPLDATLADGKAGLTLAGLELGPLKIKQIHAAGALPAEGQVGLGTAPLEVHLDTLAVSKDGVNAFLGRELLASDATADIEAKGPPSALAVTGKVGTAGGDLALSGTVDLSKLPDFAYDLVFSGDAIDTSKLLADRSRPGLSTAFKATVKGHGVPTAGGAAKLHLEIGETKVGERSVESVTLDATAEGQVARMEGLVVKAFGQTLTLDGQLDRGTREFTGRLRMSSKLADAIAKAREAGVLVTPLPPIEGELEVDFAVAGRLKPQAAADAAAPNPPPAAFTFDRLPVEVLTIKGFARGKEVVAAGKKLGALDVDVDLGLDASGPKSLRGTLTTKLGGIDTGTTKIDAVDLRVALDGLVQTITLTARDEAQKLDADLAIKSVFDLERRHVDATFERLEVQRGAFTTKLEAPFTVGLDQPDPAQPGAQSLRLPPVRLALAGGTVALSGGAAMIPDADHPGATKLERFDATVDLEGVDLGRLAALAKRSTRGLAGRLDGTLSVQGTRDNPQVDLLATLNGRMKGGEPTKTKIDLALRDKKLDLRVEVADRKKDPILTLAALAPLHLPTAPGDKPGLAPGGRLSIEAELHETTLGRLAALAPNPALAGLDPDAKLGGRLALSGTTARPEGTWSLDFEGDLLRRRGYERAPARQKLALRGGLGKTTFEGRPGTSLENRAELWLDATASPFLTHVTDARFARSPLARGFLDAGWSLDAGLAAPLDLAALSRAGLTPSPIAGTLTTKAALSGKNKDVLGELALALVGVEAGTAPRADLEATLTFAPDALRLAQTAKVAGLDALQIAAELGLPGRGLRAAIKDRARLMATPLRGEVRLVERLVSAWREALPKVPALPGKIGGALTLGGTLATPTAEGAFAWDGFDTLSGAPGRVALELTATPDRLGGGLALGGQREARLEASLARAALKTLAPTAPLPVDLRLQADEVDLLTLVPASTLAGRPLQLAGRLDWDMTGRLLLERDPAQKATRRFAPGSTLLGALTMSGLDVVVPDTDRHLRDGRVALVASADSLKIETIHFGEQDIQRADRSVDVTGALAWQDLAPRGLKVDVKTHEWLVLGLGFDGPEGELDLDLGLEVSALTEPVKQVEVTVRGMQLNAPDRFIRAHYPQFPAYDDLIYVSDAQPSGRLPPGKGAPPAPADAPATPPDPNAPETGVDVKLRIPDPIHVIFAAASPIEIKLKGGMDVAMRGKDLRLEGRLDVTEGVLGAMGREFRLQHGAITAGGGLDTAQAALVFGATPSEVALRDVAAGDHNNLATISIFASAKAGMQTLFGGVSGPYLLDMATFLNTGRTRLWGLPDAPSSETVRFGNPDQGLVNTFVQTNLRNLVFMDRTNAWSMSQQRPAEYGQLRHLDMQRFLPAEDHSRRPSARVHMQGRPLTIGQGELELGYDWLLLSEPRAVLGFGPWLGLDALRAGLGFTFDWSSED